MNNLTITPFSDKELEKEYSTNTFFERGIEFTILRYSNQSNLSTGNLYKFGVVDNEYNFFWFFHSKALVKGRIKAVEVFIELEKYCKKNNLGKPFAFKVAR